jgi:hypothetical protein
LKTAGTRRKSRLRRIRDQEKFNFERHFGLQSTSVEEFKLRSVRLYEDLMFTTVSKTRCLASVLKTREALREPRD